ncbi:MAG TPA: carboxypeptidase-like regulatory domain-containing protein, partial [Mucilaginibacter sp.]
MAKGSHAQEMTLNVDKASLKQVFKRIEQQANVTFVYDAQVINKLPSITLHIKNQLLPDILAELQQKTLLQFKLVGNYVGVAQDIGSMPILSPTATPPAAQQVINVTGSVRDASGQPLIGVSITLKGTQTGVQTDANGHFTLPANIGDVLVFSYIGYIRKEVTVTTQT